MSPDSILIAVIATGAIAVVLITLDRNNGRLSSEVISARLTRVTVAETRPVACAMAPPEGFEPPTPALGRRRSIH